MVFQLRCKGTKYRVDLCCIFIAGPKNIHIYSLCTRHLYFHIFQRRLFRATHNAFQAHDLWGVNALPIEQHSRQDKELVKKIQFLKLTQCWKHFSDETQSHIFKQENHNSKILWRRLEHVWPLQTWAREGGWELHARTAIDVGLRNCSCDVFNMCTFPEILNGAAVWPGLVWCGIRMAWPMALQMKLPHNESWPTLIIPLVFTATLATLALNKWKCLTVDWTGYW